MNTKAKGNLNERIVKAFFENHGYDVIKAGASLGVFDLICFRRDIRIIQLIGGETCFEYGSACQRINVEFLPLQNYSNNIRLQPIIAIQSKTNSLPGIIEQMQISQFNNLPINSDKLITVVCDSVRGKKGSPKTIKIYRVTAKS